MTDNDPWADFIQPQANTDQWADFVQPQSTAPDQGGVMGALKGASRAIEPYIPGMDRAIASAKSRPGQPNDYASYLATEEAKNEQFAKDNPWTDKLGGLTASAPLMSPAFAAAGGPMLMRMAKTALPWGIFGTLQGVSSSPDLTNIPDTATRAAEGGAISGTLGALAPPVAKGIGTVVKGALSPFAISPERQLMVEGLQQAGATPTAGQVTGSKFIQGLEGPNEGGFTKAIMDAGGIPASDATQASIASAKTAIGDQFTALGARNSVAIDDGLRSGVQDAVANYKRLGGGSPGVEAAANDLLSRNEPIDGDVYNSLRSGLGKDAQTLRKSDPPQAQAYRELQGALDDAMERSIKANNPDDLGAFKEVRRQYGNFQDISKAASKLTGENAVRGTIPPTGMQNILSRGNAAPGYAAGQGDLAQLTRAGVGIMQPPAGSYGNQLASALMNHSVGGLAGTALRSVGAGPLVRAPWVQAYLKNQLMRGPGAEAATNQAALAAGLAARQQSQRRTNQPQE